MFAGDAHDHVVRLRGTMRPFHGHGVIGVLRALRQLTCQGVERLIGWTAHGHYLVDAMFGRISKEIAAYIAAHPDDAETALDLFMIDKYLERLGDHAVNIAEWVEFLKTGVHKARKIV